MLLKIVAALLSIIVLGLLCFLAVMVTLLLAADIWHQFGFYGSAIFTIIISLILLVVLTR